MYIYRNLGILFALMVFGCTVYLLATEFISAKKSKGEVLLFRRGRVPDRAPKPDVESNVDGQEVVLARTKTVPDAPPSIQKQTAIFHWDGVNYDIKIKSETRRLLDDVDGWVKPGTLTALMVRVPLAIIFNDKMLMRLFRAYLVLARPRSLMCSLAGLQWEWSPVKCLSMVAKGTLDFRGKLAMSSSRIFTWQHQQLERP
jgi:hypothetical protein